MRWLPASTVSAACFDGIIANLQHNSALWFCALGNERTLLLVSNFVLFEIMK